MEKSPASQLKVGRIALPVAIGMGVVGWLFWDEMDAGALSSLPVGRHTALWIAVAFACMAVRDLGYMARLRVLSRRALGWRGCFRVIMLWEFTSAVTPSAIGGTSLAVLFVHKERVGLGESSAIVMATSFLDELYFVVVFPAVLLLAGADALFAMGAGGGGLLAVAVAGYSVKLAYLLALSYGLFVNPKGLKWLLLQVFRLPVLRRWQQGAERAGDDIVASSVELRRRSPRFWAEAFAATFFSWSARFLVANAIFMAFFGVSDHLLMFARQLAMWVMMLVSPTPGGSGFAEYVFTRYLAEFIPAAGAAAGAVAVAFALLWRAISYYPYLAVGAVVVPRWLRDKFGRAGRG